MNSEVNNNNLYYKMIIDYVKGYYLLGGDYILCNF